MDPAYPAVSGILRDSHRPLLDIGCGMGLLASWLRANGHQAPITALDVDAKKIALAQKVLGTDNARFRTGDALGFEDHSGDVVVLDVLHYFSDEQQCRLLEKIARSVSPGGVALIRVTLREPTWRFALTQMEESFIKFVRWIPTAGQNFPVRATVESAFPTEQFAVDMRPMWGRTPFNSYLFTFRRKV
jgi:2-polyprenyl-3-methyl-5-hydroxy-6-metoxy-1,4-benzoquinol methylase